MTTRRGFTTDAVPDGAPVLGGQVEPEAASGDLAGGDGAAYVQGLDGAELAQLLGSLCDRGLEVEGVGQVEVSFDVDGAVVVGALGVDVEPA